MIVRIVVFAVLLSMGFPAMAQETRKMDLIDRVRAEQFLLDRGMGGFVFRGDNGTLTWIDDDLVIMHSEFMTGKNYDGEASFWFRGKAAKIFDREPSGVVIRR